MTPQQQAAREANAAADECGITAPAAILRLAAQFERNIRLRDGYRALWKGALT